MADSPIVKFYRGAATDQSGRRLDEILQWDDEALERVHDYIQWLFPLDEPSGANWLAPVLSRDDVAAFAADPSLRASLRRAFLRMLTFYGFGMPDGQVERVGQEEQVPQLHREANWDAQSRVWLRPHNHNYLRLTRIMKCLTLLGLPDDARALRDALIKEASLAPDAVGPLTIGYWKSATT